MASYQLTEHIGADMPPRYYVDGRRVSRTHFDDMRNAPRLDCFSTRCKIMPGGRFRRTNYSITTF